MIKTNTITDTRTIRIIIGNTLVKSWRNIFQIFLNIFIWKQTNDIQVIAMFNIIYLITHTFFFTVFAPLAKKWYRNISHVFSLIWFAVVYLWIMFLWESAIHHLVIIPFLIGFFNSIYWINYHNTQFDLTTYENRGNFEWIRKAMRTTASIFIPIFIGFLITSNYMWYGYEIAFAFWALLFFIGAIVWTVKLKIKKTTKFDLLLVAKKSFSIPDVRRSLSAYAFVSFSFSNSVIEVIIPIILYNYVAVELKVWAFVSFFSIVSIIASYLFWKFVHYKYYSISIFYLWIIYAGALLWFVLFDQVEYLVVFSALITSIALLFSIPQKVVSDNVLHKIEWYKNMRSEYMVIREFFQAIGWIGSFTILYYLNSIKQEYIQIIFWFMVISVFISAFQLKKIDISKKN